MKKRIAKLQAMAVRTVEEQRELDGLLAQSMKREALKDTTHTRGVSVRVSRKEDDTNTLSFVFVSNDNGGKRYDWGSGEYYTEELDVNGANSSRLNTFFKDHTRSVDSAVGKVSNTRVEDGMLVGDVTFGSDDDSQRVFSKYSEGILTDVSIGYEIRKYEVHEGADNELDMVRVTDFDIFEVSAVGIGFDSGAKKREKEDNIGSSQMNKDELERFNALIKMLERNAGQDAELATLTAKRDKEIVDSNAERAKLLAENVELKRESECNLVASANGEVGAECLRKLDKPTVGALKDAILEARMKEQEPKSFKPEEERSTMINAMVDGLAMRCGAKIAEPAKGADNYRHASLVSIGESLLGERNLAPVEVAKRSLVTGDFPLLLQSVGARILTSEFEAQVGTYKAWMKMVDVPDFRTMTELTASFGGGRLEKIKERADLKKLGGNEKAESWKIETFGNSFELSREMLINDDLGNFSNLIGTFGRMAQTTANGISYDILQNVGAYANYKMADGSGMWVAGRNNTTTTELSAEAISACKLKMASHKSIDGKTPLNISPKYLIVSPALEEKAKEILGASSKIGADNTMIPNVHLNGYTLVVDPEIASATAWYMLADYRTFKMGFLAGTNRSPVVEQTHSSVTGSVFEGVFDIGVMLEDYRGIFRGNV